ncbi:hypothetical protein SFRA_008855 [Streptomyces xinghaiensis]|uniref:histidine kinase n=1 Tax=Streptomyces xinghaiensis TaxID=1038928 RepID=A0A3R7EW54_9ACTN|nr:hypothetical protein SFRA_008855 [Streptomyces xinghaiensis]
MRSVRAKAALGATLVVAVALVAAGAAVLWVLRDNLLGRADLEARLAAREIASQVAAGRAYGSLELPDREQPVQVVDEDGRLRAASEGLEAVTGTGSADVTPEPGPSPTGDDDDDRDDDHGGRGDDDDDPGSGEVSEDTGTRSGTATVDGETAAYRFASVEATTPRGETVTVHAGAPLATEQEAVGTVRTAMLAGLPLLLAVVAAATWQTTRRALRPVEGIRRSMAAITASAGS